MAAVGDTASITIALLAPSDPAVPGVTRVKIASFPGGPVPLIVPPFNSSDVVAL